MILADEPVASLDPVLAHTILGYLEQLNREDGITVLCSLHFLDLVHRYADRAIALNEGRVVFDGAPALLSPEALQQIYRQSTSATGGEMDARRPIPGGSGLMSHQPEGSRQ